MNKPRIDCLIEEIISRDVVQFGSFTLKSGRQSPYFFNMGKMSDAAGVALLAQHYAEALAGYDADLLFGPAYKGISLAATTAMQLWHNKQRNINWCYNRKEVKDHGEGGLLVGAPLVGRVVIVDDVLTAGTAARESIKKIRNHGAQASALLVFLDRKEPGSGKQSASEELRADGLDVLSVLSLDQIVNWLQRQPKALSRHVPAMQEYLLSLR